MRLTKIWATAQRVLRQLRHDHRTLALIMFVPCVLIVLLRYTFDERQLLFQSIAPLVLGIFPLVVMFVVTSVAMLRERTGGTLERLMVMPVSKLEIIVGYAVAFAILAVVQAVIVSAVTLGLLDVTVAGSALAVVVVAVLAAVLGMALGLLMSAFARSEFQAVQFMPAFIMPQLLICGLFIERSQMAGWLERLSDIMPLTYVVEAMNYVNTHSGWGETLSKDLIIVGGLIVVALALGAATLRRQE